MENLNEFPSYLGFGRLKPESVTETMETKTAEYYFLDKPVHRLSHDKARGTWVISDILNGKGNITSNLTLEKAVLMHFNYLDCNTNAIFKHVREQVCGLGNIHFENLATMHDKGGVISTFPAGRLLVLRLPLSTRDSILEKADILEQEIPWLEDEKRPLTALCENYMTYIIRPTKLENVVTAVMAEFIVPLASVYDVAQWICSRNLVGKEKHFRLMIQDAKLKNLTLLKSFREESPADDLAYSILLKGLNTPEAAFEVVREKLAEKYYVPGGKWYCQPPLYLNEE